MKHLPIINSAVLLLCMVLLIIGIIGVFRIPVPEPVSSKATDTLPSPRPGVATQYPSLASPPALVTLLEEAAEGSGLLENTTLEEIERRREALADEVNSLSAIHREAIAGEIVRANIALEVMELQATPDTGPDDALVSLTTIQALLEADFTGLDDAFREVVEKRFNNSGSILREYLRELANRQEDSADPLNIPSDDLSRGSLAAMLIAEAFETEDDKDRSSLSFPDLALACIEWKDESRRLQERLGDRLPGRDWLLPAGELIQDGVSLYNRSTSIGQHHLGQWVKKETEALTRRATEAKEAAWRKYQRDALTDIEFALEIAGENGEDQWEGFLQSIRDNDINGKSKETFERAVRELPNFRAEVLKHAQNTQLKKSWKDPESSAFFSSKNTSRLADGLYQLIGWKNTKELMEMLNRDLLEFCLMRVDPNLLDTPVANLYHKAFGEVWAHLEATYHQVPVAKASAGVKKRTIELPEKPWKP